MNHKTVNHKTVNHKSVNLDGFLYLGTASVDSLRAGTGGDKELDRRYVAAAAITSFIICLVCGALSTETKGTGEPESDWAAVYVDGVSGVLYTFDNITKCPDRGIVDFILANPDKVGSTVYTSENYTECPDQDFIDFVLANEAGRGPLWDREAVQEAADMVPENSSVGKK